MDCKTAQHVWNHNGGLISGLNCRMPGLMVHLTELAASFGSKKPDIFDTAVKNIAGEGGYRVIHCDGESQMAKWVHDVIGDKVANRIVTEAIKKMTGIQDLEFSNVCCNGCQISDGNLSPEQELTIQLAAVSLSPDGTPLCV